MYNTVMSTISGGELLETGSRVIIGLSGGADSVALLDFLANISGRFSLTLCAAHVNHGLRGDESDEDEAFCKNICESYGIELFIYRADVLREARAGRMSVEEAGRTVRYRVFNDLLIDTGADKIAVAHNKNDNAETVVMRFLRGAGLLGLGGIPLKRGAVIRPLLNVSRLEILRYCRDKNLKYRNDKTNQDDAYTRNKIRLKLLPYIEKELNPSIVNTLSYAAAHYAEEDRFLDSLAAKAFEECLINETHDKLTLDTKKLKNYDAVVVKRVVRMAYGRLTRSMRDLGLVHVNAVCGLLHKETGKVAELPGGAKAVATRGGINIQK